MTPIEQNHFAKARGNLRPCLRFCGRFFLPLRRRGLYFFLKSAAHHFGKQIDVVICFTRHFFADLVQRFQK